MVLSCLAGGTIMALQSERLPAAAYITTWLKTHCRQVDKEYTLQLLWGPMQVEEVDGF